MDYKSTLDVIHAFGFEAMVEKWLLKQYQANSNAVGECWLGYVVVDDGDFKAIAWVVLVKVG